MEKSSPRTRIPFDMHGDCSGKMLAVRDALDILSGKWKIQIIGVLSLAGKHRFKELERQVIGISPKMLSKELQELEQNELVRRTVLDTKPIMVEYELTAYGNSLNDVIKTLMEWGENHRKRIMARA